MTTRRGGRPPQVRPRPPSTGRPSPARPRPHAPTPGRLASHRKIERGPGIALPFRLLAGLAVIALGVGVLIIANGGLARIADAVGSTFGGLVTDLTATPAPSAADPIAADAPTLEAPDEPYTNEPSIDLVGIVPAAVVGQPDTLIRIFVAIGKGPSGPVIDVPVGTTQSFLVPMTLSPGANVFTAMIVGPTELESDLSPAVTYVFDKSKPKVTISSPKANAVVNSRSVQVVGQTQGRSAISIRNMTTNTTVAGAADGKGAFSIAVPLGTGTNKLQVTATDPAGNVNSATVTVRRGTGKLTAQVSASFYQIRRSKLPEQVRIVVTVTDPDGRALEGANATFTLAIPGVPAVTSSTTHTSSRGTATFTTTLPKGANAGQVSVTVIIQTNNYGDTTDRTVITIQ
ncbi:MAG: hypothetical protein H0V73_05860 [Chloroflexi bacterium]|nr:hypothetical protein [Chloroflexota bacterium]